MGFAASTFADWAGEARRIADDRRKAWRKTAKHSWDDWVSAQLRSGAGALHRFTKREEAPPPLPVIDSSGNPSLRGQDIVDSDFRGWAKVWGKYNEIAGAPWRGTERSSERCRKDLEQMPPITVADVKRCANTFAARTGRGCEDFHPRWFGWLSDDLICKLIALLHRIEDVGYWPGNVRHTIIALIPKNDGGRRPIGLLPALVRLWEKIRRPVVATWRVSVLRPYNWAAKGRSPQAAVWKEALRSEAACARGHSSGAVLIDLVKAFEYVKLELIWYAGLRLGFPVTMLALILESFSFARRLKCNGIYSDEFHTLSAILAGGGYATDALFLVLADPCDALLRRFPGTDICLFVDDLTIHARGTEGEVASLLPAATDWCIQTLEEELHLKVSRAERPFCIDKMTKTVATVSSAKLGKRIAPSLRRFGVATQRQVKFLGIDYAAGKCVGRKIQKKRFVKVLSRIGRYKMLGKKGGTKVLRTGAGPAVRYGASVLGTNSTWLCRIRRFACAVQGEMRRRSPFGRLKLAKYDPAKLMAIDPIVDWARAWWDGVVGCDDLEIAWKTASVQVGLARHPFQKVSGPAGALIASAHRINWKVPSPRYLLTDNDVLIDLHEVCPAVVQQYAEWSYESMQARDSAMARRLGYIPNLDPLSEIVNGSRSTSSARESLRALGEDGWWTQSRLHREGFPGVTDDVCRACNSAVGTLWHRCVACSVTAAVREEYNDQDILYDAQSALLGGSPLFVNGIPALEEEPKGPPFVERWCGGVHPADNDPYVFTGNVFTDGAMRGPALARLRRAGWAAVAVDDNANIVYGLYGTCPDPFPTAFRAELLAVERVLAYAWPPVKLHIDNQEVINGISRGKLWCCNSMRPAADLWRKIWWRIDDIGIDSLTFVKVKGHATDNDVLIGNSTWWSRRGNQHADFYAGRGADVSEHLAPVEQARQRHDYAKRWYRWLLTLASHWPDDVQKYEKEKVNVTSNPLHGEQDGAAVASVARPVPPAAASLRHRGADERARAVAEFGHQLYCIGEKFIFCKKCARYSAANIRGLKMQCDPDPSKRKMMTTGLSRMLDGRHPVSARWIGTPHIWTDSRNRSENSYRTTGQYGRESAQASRAAVAEAGCDDVADFVASGASATVRCDGFDAFQFTDDAASASCEFLRCECERGCESR